MKKALTAVRSRSGSDAPPERHSFPSRRSAALHYPHPAKTSKQDFGNRAAAPRFPRIFLIFPLSQRVAPPLFPARRCSRIAKNSPLARKEQNPARVERQRSAVKPLSRCGSFSRRGGGIVRMGLTFSLRLGHARVLTAHCAVIHSPRAVPLRSTTLRATPLPLVRSCPAPKFAAPQVGIKQSLS